MKRRLDESDFHTCHMAFCHLAPKMINRMRQEKNSSCKPAAVKLLLSRNQRKVVCLFQCAKIQVAMKFSAFVVGLFILLK